MARIIFDGYLTGAAERHFRKKSILMGQNILLLGTMIALPFIIYIAIQTRLYIVLYLYILMVASVPLMIRIPKNKKKQLSVTPKQILIDKYELICIADQYREVKYAEDIKAVYDYGEFYDIVFPFGKISEKFVCQKSLLSKGTLEEFELIFADKIIKKM